MRNIFIFLVIGLGLYITYFAYFGKKKELQFIDQLRANYEAEIEAICKEMRLPAEYFKALVILESSAEKPSGNRFEQHIYEKLKAVKDGEQERYGSFTQKQLQILSDNTLEKMATSWGPLQIMGYHCIPMGITLEQLKEGEALRYGIIWCEKSYGNYLRNKDFQNAFHIHNTGRPIPESGFPITHDPDYIPKGMAYIAVFKK